MHPSPPRLNCRSDGCCIDAFLNTRCRWWQSLMWHLWLMALSLFSHLHVKFIIKCHRWTLSQIAEGFLGDIFRCFINQNITKNTDLYFLPFFFFFFFWLWTKALKQIFYFCFNVETQWRGWKQFQLCLFFPEWWNCFSFHSIPCFIYFNLHLGENGQLHTLQHLGTRGGGSVQTWLCFSASSINL